MTARSHPRPESVPRPLLFAVGALLAITLTGVAVMRMAGVAPAALPPVAETAAERAEVRLDFLEAGGTRLVDPVSGETLAELAPETDGFLRGISRALIRERGRSGLSMHEPIALMRWKSGHMALLDPSTGWRTELVGFGPGNLETMAVLMSDIRDSTEAQR